MKKIRHVVIWVLVVCFFACISPVAFAVDSDYSLWEWLLNKNIPWLGDLSGCTEAPAGNHNFQYIPGEGTFCTYCGISYSDYSAAAYQQSLDEAQTTEITDEGFYLVIPISSVNTNFASYFSFSGVTLTCNNSTTSQLLAYVYSEPSEFPVGGTYYYRPLWNGLDSSGSVTVEFTSSSSVVFKSVSLNTLASAKSFLRICTPKMYFPVSSVTSCVPFRFYAVPDNWNNVPDGLLPDVDRIGNITGDVVVIGDGSEVTVYKDCQFVDEENNRYYNPTTNTWNTYNSYSYDYSTFTYNFVTDAGDTIINYGDEYISISETVNSVTNNYYYYYYVQPPEPADPDTCDHTYTSEVTREPSCTLPGVVTYTCSICGRQYTDTVDALGHDWLLKESVLTTYSVDTSVITCPDDGSTNFTYTLDEETGTYTFTNINTGYEWTVPATVTQGYDLYKCSRCGEIYRDYDGSGPPDENGGLFAAIGDFIANGISWILDKLKQLVESVGTINDAFTSYIEDLKAVGGEYPLFLGAIAAILPEDLMTVVWFGVISACAVLAYKRWFK